MKSFIRFIKDRIFSHKIVALTQKFHPKSWRVKLSVIGKESFINNYLKSEIDQVVTFWPRINSTKAKIGLKVIKKLFIDMFIDDKEMNLVIFGQYIIKEYQSHGSMISVRQLYGSFLVTLPTAMMLENWNSISTLLWSDLRKLLNTDSIDECLKVKVNGSPLAAYDPRIVASQMANKSRDWNVDIQTHVQQKYLNSFFKDPKKE